MEITLYSICPCAVPVIDPVQRSENMIKIGKHVSCNKEQEHSGCVEADVTAI